jgi:hypothetical protein
MRKNSILSESVAAAASLAILAAASHAAVLVNGTDGAGELFIGFRATGGDGLTKNVVMDLGSVSDLSALATGSVVSLGNIGTDLAAQFGSTWYERTDLLWSSVAGVGNTATADPTSTLYGGVASTTAFPLTTAGYSRAGASAQGPVATQILSMASSTGGFTAASAGASSNIGIENTTDSNSWSSKFGASPFSGFSSPSGQQFEQAFSIGTIATGVEGALDVFRMLRNGQTDSENGLTGGAGTYQGTLTINSLGDVGFQVEPVAVPEPASAGFLTSAALLGIAVLRRKRGAQPSLAC